LQLASWRNYPSSIESTRIHIAIVTRAAANFYISRPLGRRKADENRLHFLLGGNGPPRTETSHYCAAGCGGRGRVGAPPADRPPRGAAGARGKAMLHEVKGALPLRRGLIVLLLTLALVVSAAGAAAAQTLRVGVNAAFPPFEY